MRTQINLKVWQKRVIGLIPILLIGLIAFLPCIAPAPAHAATRYIFTTFTSDAAAGEKLWVYTSSDAVNFNLLSSTGFGGPTGVLRDPSIMKHSDGKYYICFTIQSWTTSSTYFAIAYSSDLLGWTTLTTVNAGVSGTYYTWAPEWFIEGGTVKIIVSLGPQGSNFKPYIFTAANNTLTSWNGPVDMGIGTNHIDTFVVKSGSTYHAFCKDETSKYVEHATASSLTGPWNWVGTGNWSGWGSGIEGPALAQMDNGTWRIYVDNYSGSGGIKTATSSDLNSWSGLSAAGVSGVRHGTVLRDTNSTPTPVVTATPTPVQTATSVRTATPKPVTTATPVPATGSIKVQFLNQSTATTNNQLYLNFQLVNTGTGAITLSNVKMKYYYTVDGTRAQNFYCDYSPVGGGNVTGAFVTMSTAKTGADTYLEVGFTSGAGSLAAGASTVIQSRIAKSDWSNYTQTNDYSFNSTATNYVDWAKTTGYVSGALQWGNEP